MSDTAYETQSRTVGAVRWDGTSAGMSVLSNIVLPLDGGWVFSSGVWPRVDPDGEGWQPLVLPAVLVTLNTQQTFTLNPGDWLVVERRDPANLWKVMSHEAFTAEYRPVRGFTISDVEAFARRLRVIVDGRPEGALVPWETLSDNERSTWRRIADAAITYLADQR